MTQVRNDRKKDVSMLQGFGVADIPRRVLNAEALTDYSIRKGKQLRSAASC
jgi:hypothetical protein